MALSKRCMVSPLWNELELRHVALAFALGLQAQFGEGFYPRQLAVELLAQAPRQLLAFLAGGLDEALHAVIAIDEGLAGDLAVELEHQLLERLLVGIGGTGKVVQDGFLGWRELERAHRSAVAGSGSMSAASAWLASRAMYFRQRRGKASETMNLV